MTASPKTIAQAEAQIISRMRGGKACIDRLKRTGEYEKYANPEMNPEGVEEVSFGITATARDWRAVQNLVKTGAVIIVNGSIEAKSVYLIAGPNFPKA